VGFTPDGLSTAVAPDVADLLFLGGLPSGRERFTLNTTVVGSPTNSRTFDVQAWHGMLTEFRAAPSVSPTFPLSGPGTVPRRRYTDATGTSFLIHFAEKRGWIFRNESPSLGGSAGVSQIAELVLIADDLGDSRFDRYDSVVYRDRLFITNGVGRMQEVRFRRFSHPDGPFFVHNAGMIQPTIGRAEVSIEYGPVPSRMTPQGGNPRPEPGGDLVPLASLSEVVVEAFPTGVYQFWVAFYDDRGLESEPAQIGGALTIPVDGHAVLTERTGARRSITGAVLSGGLARFTTSVAHGFSPGDEVEIWASSVSDYVGVYTVSATPTTTTFECTGVAFNGTATATVALAEDNCIDLYAAGGLIPEPYVHLGSGYTPYEDEASLVTEDRRADKPRVGEYFLIRLSVASGPFVEGFYVVRAVQVAGDLVYAFVGAETATTTFSVGGGKIQFIPTSAHIAELPRSTDRQTVGRRMYCSASGGGDAQFKVDVEDNVTDAVTLIGPANSTTGLIVNRRGIPPKARLIAAAQGGLVIANLPDLAAGRSAIAYSDQQEVSYWPTFQRFVLDSQDGEAVVGIGTNLGGCYPSKRNSIWSFVRQGTLAQVSAVNDTVGIGGGMTGYDNLLFGTGERGVYQFDSAGVRYLSMALEGDWADVHLTDKDLLNHFGAFHRDESQWWISVRAPANFDGTPLPETANRRIYVMHTQVGSGYSWTRLTVPPHTYMESITDPVSQRPEILLGCEDGRILRYDREVFIDGTIDEPGPARIANGFSDQLLLGFGSVTGRTLTVLGELDLVQAGLRGMQIIVVTTSTVQIATVVANTANTITLNLDTGLTNTPVLFEIGSYVAYYTTPWIAVHRHQWLQAQHWFMEFDPLDGEVEIAYASAIQSASTGQLNKPERTWRPEMFSTEKVSMARGYLGDQIRAKDVVRGRYFRMKVGTSPGDLSIDQTETLGIRSPWRVHMLGFGYLTTGSRGSGASGGGV